MTLELELFRLSPENCLSLKQPEQEESNAHGQREGAIHQCWLAINPACL